MATRPTVRRVQSCLTETKTTYIETRAGRYGPYEGSGHGTLHGLFVSPLSCVTMQVS